MEYLEQKGWKCRPGTELGYKVGPRLSELAAFDHRELAGGIHAT